MYDSSRCDKYANGRAIIEEINPSIPVIKISNIVSGINGNIRILAGRDTSESIPVEYKSIGSTEIVAPSVVATSSRKPNRAGMNLTHFMIFGAI